MRIQWLRVRFVYTIDGKVGEGESLYKSSCLLKVRTMTSSKLDEAFGFPYSDFNYAIQIEVLQSHLVKVEDCE